MEYIKDQRILGGIIKITQYKDRIGNLLNKAHLQLIQKEEKEIIIGSLIEELQSIRDEVMVIDYFQENAKLSNDLFLYGLDLNELLSFSGIRNTELIKTLEKIRNLLMTANSTRLDWLIGRIDGLINYKEDFNNPSFLFMIRDFIYFLFFCTCNIPLFNDIPVEPEFGTINRIETPRIAFKNFLSGIHKAVDELQHILISDLTIRSLKLPNGTMKIQVECIRKGNDDDLNRRNWGSRKIYKDLLIEQTHILTFSLLNDLVQIDTICTSGKKTMNEALTSIRLQRKFCIERNVQAFMGWSDRSNSYQSIKSIYQRPFTILALLVFAGLFIIGFYMKRNIALFLFQSIDTLVSIILFGVLFYLLYLIIYGRLSKNGQFEINVKDILQHVPNELQAIINHNSKKQNQKELLKTVDNLNVKLAIYFHYLHPSKKVWLTQTLNLGNQSDTLLLEHITAIIQKSEKSKIEQCIIEEIFSKQLIIIPAVYDENLVELINRKVRSTDYPNVKFLIALEERDTKSLHLIHEAIHQGKLASELTCFFGPAELVNNPDQQRKPLNKPKNVNKTLSHFLNQLEGIIEDDHSSKNQKKPDFIMIWDLEDDPGQNQLWSMIIAHTMISSTIDQVLCKSESLDKENFFGSLSCKELTRTDKELYKNVIRFGMDLKLPCILEYQYKKALKKKVNNTKEEIEGLINELGIKADIDLWNRAKTELDYLEQSVAENENTNKEKSIEVQRALLSQIANKYATIESFVCEEFRRRMMPADIQGILIARMYGESPLSPLEWEFWFDLVLPGLLSYKFDKLILPLSLLGAIVGGFLLGAIGVMGGALSMGVLGYALGSLLLKLNIDVRNKVGLSFSAGTTNNFDFKTLIYTVSAYPEYNIAEDWSIALELNKMKYRSLLVNGYGTPTYEDSLAPLGPPMWSQHSRWMGGHIQSFPQVLINPKEILKSYGLSNWFHSFVLIVLFSLTPILAGYAVLKLIFYGMVIIISEGFLFMGLSSYSDLFINAKDFIVNLTWWVPDNLISGLFFLLIGPITIIILGMIPILWKRPDDAIMVEKSIEDLKRKKEELRQFKNKDIQNIIKYIKEIRWIAEDKEDKEGENSNAQSNGYLLASDTNPIWNSTFISVFGKNTKYHIKNEAHLERIVNATKAGLHSLLQKDVEALEKRIIQLEEGQIFHRMYGAQKYSLAVRFTMNFGMIYYYLHSTFAIILYIKQMNQELDNQWRQTNHRTYGKAYYKKIQKIMLNEIANNK